MVGAGDVVSGIPHGVTFLTINQSATAGCCSVRRGGAGHGTDGHCDRVKLTASQGTVYTVAGKASQAFTGEAAIGVGARRLSVAIVCTKRRQAILLGVALVNVSAGVSLARNLFLPGLGKVDVAAGRGAVVAAIRTLVDIRAAHGVGV